MPIHDGRLGLPGPQPHDRGADLPPRPDARRGARAGAAADRGRDQGHAAGPARLLHVPAPGVRAVRAGPRGADLALRGRARVLGRRARPAPAVAARDRARRTCSRPSRAWWRWPTRSPSPSRWPRARRCSWRSTAARGETRLHDHGAAAGALRASAGASAPGSDVRRLRLRRARSSPAARSRAPRSPATPAPGPSEPVKVEDRVLGGFGWQREDMKLVQQMAATGPGADRLARLRRPAGLPVARAPEPGRLLQGVGGGGHQPGDRPRARGGALLLPRGARRPARRCGGRRGASTRWRSRSRCCSAATTAWPRCRTRPTAAIAHEHKTYLLEDLWEAFRGRSAVLDISCLESEDTRGAIERLKQEATTAVRGGRRAAGALATAPPTRATAAISTRTWRWPPWTWRCASTTSSDGRDQPAPALRRGAALGGACATCTTWCSRSGWAPTPCARTRWSRSRWWTTTAPTWATWRRRCARASRR